MFGHNQPTIKRLTNNTDAKGEMADFKARKLALEVSNHIQSVNAARTPEMQLAGLKALKLERQERKRIKAQTQAYVKQREENAKALVAFAARTSLSQKARASSVVGPNGMFAESSSRELTTTTTTTTISTSVTLKLNRLED